MGTDTEKPIFDFEAVFEVDDYMYFYSDILTDEMAEYQVDSLVSYLELDSPKKILDMACGFGRHANRLAVLGHRVVGIDISTGFLEIARRTASELKVKVEYRQVDIREIKFEDEFDRVLLLFTSFGYFEDAENLVVLENAARALKAGGLLVFDTHNRDVFLNSFRPHHVTEKDGNLMIDRISFDTDTGRMYNDRIIIRDSVRKDMRFFVRLYNPSEIRALLDFAGLDLYRLYGDWDGSPVSSESRRMIIIARKGI